MTPRARILLLTHEFLPYRGGIAALADGLARGAVACGYEPVVLAPDYGGARDGEEAARPYETWRFAGGPGSVVSPRRLARFALHCRRAIERARPQIVHGVDPSAHMALTALSRLGAAREYFFHVAGSELLRYHREPLPRVWMAGAFRRVRGVCAVSRAVCDLLLRWFPAAGGRAFAAYPGIAARWFEAPPADRATVRRSWGAAPDELVLLTAGRRVAEKGHDRVLAALALLEEPLRRRTLYVVAGSGPEEYAGRLSAAAQAAAVRLLLLGGADDPALVAACDASDLYVMPSRRSPKRLEGLGLSYLEAAARGLPSLACDTGGVAEAVRDDETGVLLPEEADPQRLADALRELLKAPEHRARLGRGARAFARAFTHERHAAEVYGRFEAMRAPAGTTGSGAAR